MDSDPETDDSLPESPRSVGDDIDRLSKALTEMRKYAEEQMVPLFDRRDALDVLADKLGIGQ